MASINQNAYPDALPNFRNLGILLRILLIVIGVSVIAAVLRTSGLRSAWQELIAISALVQPVLIASLVALGLANTWLRRLPYLPGALMVLGLELALTTLVYGLGRDLYGGGNLIRNLFFALTISTALLFYFNLRSRALSPALSEARLQALHARIRPHFLFNSINAVLSLVRADPKRAEVALQDMADLFRVIMADNRQLSTLAREVALCRQYLNLEQLRLGERLQIDWRIDNMPQDALIPPLVLQPLIENAVYHGIEPAIAPGVISIDIYMNRNQVHAVLRNPYDKQGGHHTGNKMALENVRERLALHFDAEGSLKTAIGDNSFQVHITIPYLRETA
ncbi:MAG: sensor histidine kinase [Burkholderiales bacterium]|nr:histidine kinase [Burkholderiales bacterium]MDQ3196110.1 histidine kinase [Pseudomonadota bacterium]